MTSTSDSDNTRKCNELSDVAVGGRSWLESEKVQYENSKRETQPGPSNKG